MINKDSKILYKNKTYDLMSFGKKFGAGEDINEIISLAEKLYKKGRITIKNGATPEEELVNKIKEQDEVIEVNKALNEEEELSKSFKRKQTLEESDTTSFELLFTNSLETQKFYNYVLDMGIDTCEM